MSDKKYKTTYVMGDGNLYISITRSKPDLINYVCPNCGAYPMKYYRVYLHKTVYVCEVCSAKFDEDDKCLTKSSIEDIDLLDVIEV